MSNALGYREDIDGMRAVAVVAVVLYHIGWAHLAGGFVGVDVFFAISGFLITSILLKEVAQGNVRLRHFWMRRIRRLAPALVVLLLVTTVVFSYVLPPTRLADFGRSLASQALLLSNMYFAKESSYFGMAAESRPLLHTWSLAVEEQYYLVFPFLVALFAHFKPIRRYLVAAVLIVVGASLAFSVVYTAQSPDRAFYVLPTRAWELGARVLLALTADRVRNMLSRLRGPALELLGVGGLAAVLYASVAYDEFTPFPSWRAAVPVIGTVVLIAVGMVRRTAVGRALGVSPIVYIGKISYSLYLWHWVVIVFLRSMSPGPLSPLKQLIAVVASVTAGIVSYQFVELPTRDNRRVFSNARLVALFVAGTVLFSSTGLVLSRTRGLRSRLGEKYVAPVRSSRAKECFPDSGRQPVFCQVGPKGRPPRFVAVGDSHALSVLPAIDAIATESNVPGLFAGSSGCLPFAGAIPIRRHDSQVRCEAMVDRALGLVEQQGVRNLLLVARWAYYTERSGIDGSFQPVTSVDLKGSSIENSRAVFARQLKVTVDRAVAAGARVFVLEQVPHQLLQPEDAYFKANALGLSPEALGVEFGAYQKMIQFPHQVFSSTPGVVVLSPGDVFCEGHDTCKLFRDGRWLYYDDDHLSVDGAALLGGLFRPVISQFATSG